MSLTAGTRLGPYEILAAIGAGGMGEVYRARDTRLDRDVAIKILPETFAHDPERVARFEREAKTLAALNHPNIGGIHGLEEANGVSALVLELVEGPTLADRIAQGAIPLDEALPIARQIAEALEAAHEQGIIHRDLKPANIKVRDDGTVKVLDFGLAKLSESAGNLQTAAEGASLSPTITSPALVSGVGVLLGTAAYMSPEQAKGKPADKRSDIWAFGCVLYEMLAGKRAFYGEDVSDTLAAVLRGEPDWKAFPPDIVEPIRTLVQRCLEKDRRTRISDIAVAKYVLLEGTRGAAVQPEPDRRLSAWHRMLPWALAGALGVALAVVIMRWAPWQITPSAAPIRFGILPPTAQPLALGNINIDRQLAISPDGARVVYVAGNLGETQLMVRALDRLEAEPLRGTTGARAPFISPDGGWVGFFQGTELKKVSITGGPPITVCRIDGGGSGAPRTAPRGASWSPDDTIVFASTDSTTGLMSVPAGGGEPRVLTKPDAAQAGIDHVFPSVLPGGRAVLFTISSGRDDTAQVSVLNLETGQQKTLIRGGSHAEYVESGHLVYTAAGTLRAVRFDPVRLEVLSDPVPVVEQIVSVPGMMAQYSVSPTGALVYVPSKPDGGRAARSLVWVNRQGREEPVKAPPRVYHALRLSPDGARVALDVRDQENDIWVWDFLRQTHSRLTFDPAPDNYPVWTPDGRRIVFNRASGGLFWRPADGTGAEERLTQDLYVQFAMSFSPDGKSLVVTELKASNDLSLLPMDGKGQTTPLVQTTFTEGLGEISPDGRWLAYQSNESGQDQIYVRPFPDVNGGRWQISPGGGTKPAWARRSRELFYLDGAGALTTVPIQTTPVFSAGNPTKLFDARYFSAGQGRSYDVSPDDQRFLFIKEIPADQSTTPASMVVVLNWQEELKRLVPLK